MTSVQVTIISILLQDLESSDEDFQPPPKKLKSKSKSQVRQSRSASGLHTQSSTATRGSKRKGRGRGRLVAEDNSEERLATHEEQIQVSI